MELVYPNERRLFVIAAIISTLFWVVVVLGTLGIALIYALFVLLFAIIVQASFISYVKGSGVRVTSQQYPDVYERLQACCRKVGLEEVPETYLLRTDFFNALATRFLRRHYIILFTDVVDALKEQPDALNFYIGHELGHIHRNHIRWGWFLFPSLFLPVLGTAYRRAEEYTCDRYGNACCDNEADATAAVAAIAAGDTRWQSINVPAYLEQTRSTGGFWMSLNELLSDYPWLSKRMAWIVAMRRSGTPPLPRRHPLAWFLSLFVPRLPGGAASALVVIAVIGILAAIALPAYRDYVKRAEEAAALAMTDSGQGMLSAENLLAVQNELGELRGQVAEYVQLHGAFPASLSELGSADDVVYSSFGGMPIGIYQDGVIAVYFGTGDEGEMYFVNEPAGEATDLPASLQWYCFGQNIPLQYLPPDCR